MADFDPDAYLAKADPPAAVTPSVPSVGGFDPDAYLKHKETGELGQQVLTGIEGLSSGTFGVADHVANAMRSGATAMGLPNEYLDYVAPSKEARKERAEENPGSALIGNLVGGMALGKALPMGSMAENALVAKGVAPWAARAIGYGAEGAAFGAGNINSDLALGDPNLNSQKIMQTIGTGALMGSGLGLLSYGLVAKFPSAAKILGENPEIPLPSEGAAGSVDEAVGGIGSASPEMARPGVTDVPSLGIKKSSVDEIEKG